jgi:hypothetical protein
MTIETHLLPSEHTEGSSYPTLQDHLASKSGAAAATRSKIKLAWGVLEENPHATNSQINRVFKDNGHGGDTQVIKSAREGVRARVREQKAARGRQFLASRTASEALSKGEVSELVRVAQDLKELVEATQSVQGVAIKTDGLSASIEISTLKVETLRL